MTALEAIDAESRKKALFKQDELEALGMLLDMSTLEVHEIERCKIHRQSYRFLRRLHMKPRPDLVRNMLDLEDIDNRGTIEGITGRTFVLSETMTLYDVHLYIDDPDGFLCPVWVIAGLAATVVFAPFALFAMYKRCKARRNGVTLVLRGGIHINRGGCICPKPNQNVGNSTGHSSISSSL